ncbi:MAG: hypothetical protein ABSG43_23485 [Solirubrobacteraceae bacterium]
MSRPAPPSGAPPPELALTSDGQSIDLRPLAGEICRRYRNEFPDEDERYGPAGAQWCLHDNQYLLAWAIQDARDGTVVMSAQALWLARVLSSRQFPVARLVRDLEIASDVVRLSRALGELAPAAADALAAAARAVADRHRD